MTATATTGSSTDPRTAASVVDSDVHAVVTSARVLFPYLSAHWREQIQQTGFSGPSGEAYPPRAPTSVRPRARPSADEPVPGSTLASVREHVLDAWRVDHAVVNCAYAVESIRNPDAAVAMAAAVNDWLVAEWLEPEPRLRASLVVPTQNPAAAAAEIARVGAHPGFVQVFLPARSAAPYGQRVYQPLFAAAVEHDLVAGVQYGGFTGNPPTPVGWPSHYLEEYVGMASVVQAQVMSLVCEGVFDRFPTLRVAVVEAGFTWLPSLMWRLDKEWKGLRREVPWVRRPPSEYIREHMRFTTQPLDAPDRPEALHAVIDQLGSDELLMFSSDFPHWHFDTPEQAFPLVLPAGRADKLMAGNARAFYRLG